LITPEHPSIAAGVADARVSELAGLRWRNLHATSITIEERYSRGDFDQPKSAASRTTIPVDSHVLARIERLKKIEVLVKAGRATRRYKAVKSAEPDDLVFQSVVKGSADAGQQYPVAPH
jgi:hypothetical protein